MDVLFWIGLVLVFLGGWMWWEVKHAEEVPEDYDEESPAVDYDDNWFEDKNSKVKIQNSKQEEGV